MSTFDVQHSARSVAENWQMTLGTIPPALAKIVAVFSEAEWAQPPAAAFPVADATRENVADLIAEYAEKVAVAQVFAKAQNDAREQLARQVLAVASEAVPAVLDGLRPEFDRAAMDYVEAVAQLPDRFDGDQLSDAPDHVQAAYKAAQVAAATISAIGTFLGTLGDLPGHQASERNRYLKVMRPSDRKDLALLLSSHKVSKAEAKLDAGYLVATRAGIPFEMHTPQQAAEIRREIDAMPTGPGNNSPKGRW